MTVLLLRAFYIAAFLSCWTAVGHAQLRTYHDVWYFGDSLGLDFRGGNPIPVKGASHTFEGCASISDSSTGEILFYTNGETVRNRHHRPMKNGTGLYGNLSATQGALIVPDPANPLLFYLFTLDGTTNGAARPASGLGLRYSIVDMGRDNGDGEVTTKNIPLLTTAGEKLVGVRHENGRGVWIVTHELHTNRFHAWLLNERGEIEGPVVSEVGETYGSLDIGHLKASPDGKLLFALHTYFGNVGELFRFNPATGAVEETIAQLPMPRAVYGASFSAEGRFLYVGEESEIAQYDLRDIDRGSDEITRSIVGSVKDGGVTYAMQLGPDRRIYVLQEYDEAIRIGVIAKPGLRGSACDFQGDPGLPHQLLSPIEPYRYIGLPNCIDGYFQDTTTPLVEEKPDTCAAPSIVRLRIGRDHRAKTDVPFVIPIEPMESLDAPEITELEFELEYDPNVMLLQAESIGSIQAGAVLEDWEIKVRAHDAGRLTLHCTAPPGKGLVGDGPLLRLECRLYISNVGGTELPFTLNTSTPCHTFETEAGRAEPEICWLNFRLIELTAAKYVAPIVYPNPAPERVTFEFGLGLDGRTRLEIVDMSGNLVGTIFDAELNPGRYGVEWDVRGLPSGTYWYRLSSGDWKGEGQVRVAR